MQRRGALSRHQLDVQLNTLLPTERHISFSDINGLHCCQILTVLINDPNWIRQIKGEDRDIHNWRVFSRGLSIPGSTLRARDSSNMNLSYRLRFFNQFYHEWKTFESKQSLESGSESGPSSNSQPEEARVGSDPSPEPLPLPPCTRLCRQCNRHVHVRKLFCDFCNHDLKSGVGRK